MDLLFSLCSAVALAGALLAVTRRNPVYAAAWMMASLFALAGIFVQLHSTFLGTVQILLYAGAIIVLFVFVIMLLNQSRDELEAEQPPRSQRLVAAGVAGLLFVLAGGRVIGNLEGASLREPAPAAPVAAAPPSIGARPAAAPADGSAPLPPGVSFGDVPYFGRMIYDRHLVAFELISVLVLAAIAAVIVLAKRELEHEDDALAAARAAAAARAQGGGGPAGAGADAPAPDAAREPALEEARP